LYVIWPFLPDEGFAGVPRLHVVEFEEKEKTYRCREEDFPEGAFRAFGWSKVIPKEVVQKNQKLRFAGFPALTPQLAVANWKRHMRAALEHTKTQKTRIEAALRDFKTPKELKHGE
jgi:hypothetical protein